MAKCATLLQQHVSESIVDLVLEAVEVPGPLESTCRRIRRHVANGDVLPVFSVKVPMAAAPLYSNTPALWNVITLLVARPATLSTPPLTVVDPV